jgi:hypothetical protein
MIFSALPADLGKNSGAGDGIQTRDLRLGKATLYQLSYSREKLKETDLLRTLLTFK